MISSLFSSIHFSPVCTSTSSFILVEFHWVGGGLAGEVEVEGDAVAGVGGGEGAGGDDGGVHLVGEVGAEGEALAHHVVGGEVDAEGAGAGCGLGVVFLDAAYQGLVVLEGEVAIEGEVVADALLAAFHLQDCIECHYLIAATDGEAFCGGFHHLSGAAVEGKCALVAIFDVALHVVVEGGAQAYEGGEFLGDCHRGYVVWR